MSPNKTRCPWVSADPVYISYHDQEWGVHVHDDRKMFEFLTLEAFQAGLNWLTILKKRENFRNAFDDFDWEKIARYGKKDFDRLMSDPGIVRNKLKINAAIHNATLVPGLIKEFGSLCNYFWQWVEGKPVKNELRQLTDYPSRTDLSDAISKDMKRRGFKFVGSTIIYAHMQATGMVNDHVMDCFRRNEVGKVSRDR